MSTIADKYNLFSKGSKLTFNLLPSLIISCGYMPSSELSKTVADVKKKNHGSEEEISDSTNISLSDFTDILEKCQPFKATDELLQHILFFTNKQVVIKKDQFEKMINIKGKDNETGLTQKELESLYEIMNVKDDKINLEEFVQCIVEE